MQTPVTSIMATRNGTAALTTMLAEASRMAQELVGVGGEAESYSMAISRIYGYSIRQIYIIEKPGEVYELRGCGCWSLV